MLWASGIDWGVSGVCQSELLVHRLSAQRECSLALGFSVFCRPPAVPVRVWSAVGHGVDDFASGWVGSGQMQVVSTVGVGVCLLFGRITWPSELAIRCTCLAGTLVWSCLLAQFGQSSDCWFDLVVLVVSTVAFGSVCCLGELVI